MFEPINLIINDPNTWETVSISEDEVDLVTKQYLNEDFGDAYKLPKEYEHLKNINDYLVSYEKINQYLRCNSLVSNEIECIIKNVSSILGSFTIGETILVYRGCHPDIYQKMIQTSLDEGIGEGYLIDPSFLSTTLLKEKAFSDENGFENNKMLRILLLKDSCAFYVGNLIGEGGRYEVLLPRYLNLKIVSEDSKFVNWVVVNS